MRPTMEGNGTSNGNGSGKTALAWIAGLLIGPLAVWVGNTTVKSAERIAVIEVQYRELREAQSRTEEKLDRILASLLAGK